MNLSDRKIKERKLRQELILDGKIENTYDAALKYLMKIKDQFLV